MWGLSFGVWIAREKPEFKPKVVPQIQAMHRLERKGRVQIGGPRLTPGYGNT